MSNVSLSSSGYRRVPRPMICLKSTIDPMGLNRTMFLTVGRSTPVERSLEVVAITGVADSGSAKLPSVLLPDIAFQRNDPHHVVGVLADEVIVRFHQCASHLSRMLRVDAEDDGLRHASSSAQVVGQVPRRGVGPGQE